MSDNAKRVKQKRSRRQRAHKRVRSRLSGTGARPRLAVFKSLKYVYAQVIDDSVGQTLVQASSLDPEIRSQIGAGGSSVAAAKLVGQAVADRAREKGIETVVFDRGGYIYHGKVRAIAEAAREGGLKF